ncbi:50S ribosome-binding GTPase [Rhodococcus ruber]|uniref:50S ribosome-binding GTPase n=1 Tax=Rhodococcus ruber TaxID=1830 RepID=A0ABT4MN67_9NOCA|nr:dynamin family protein [Rhodococcus ruber]MCZ4521191.1 50S ribosome-binding GTPase [Rhodococcus ruber]
MVARQQQPSTPLAARNIDMRAVLDRGLHALAALAPDLVHEANRIGAILWSPPRIVVVGRLKAGKSTLVNALIGAPIAETAALEATNVVTVYENGAPSRADVVGIDGSRRSVVLEHGRRADLGVPASEVGYVHRFLPSDALADVTLIDTPGLATLTVENEQATHRALIDGYEQTRAASVDADAAIFLFDSTPRADEMKFLRQLGFTPLNTLGVLSRADSFGEGALGRVDPIEHARSHAVSLATTLASSVATVIPISGLLAETSHTGRITESDARALHRLAHLQPLELFDLMESDDPAPLDAATRDRLLDLIGEYGMVGGRGPAGAGAYSLSQWLVARSGVDPLREVLNTALRDFATLHRANRVLSELDSLAFTHPFRDRIRAITDSVRRDRSLQPVLLFQALRGMLLADESSPVVGELMRVLTGRNDAERLGLHVQAHRAQVVSVATERIEWAAGRSISTATAAEDAALGELIRLYTTIRSNA